MNLKFKVATANDAQFISDLVNAAYRPTGSHKGWTHESELISGERTSPEQILSLFCKYSYVLLSLKNDKLVACIHVEIDGDCAILGMLATNPEFQGLGYGKKILAYAENFSSQKYSVYKYVMKVILSRSELLDFYIRRGYKVTNITYDYPVSAGVGIPKVTGLRVGVLEKLA